eukprot:TRINITY_DN3487_c0_g1_i6.p1 TRINITY_DN3487_c0_g1~~TRINITY_DN3487_c0_g1_i6.p1  ORF type:complete len:2370 (+),score=455.76 TRINITY_DN3487_c0_g1_i6:1580-8689(+)
MTRASQDAGYYRTMESVVVRTMTRLLENVLTQRPKNSKEVLMVVARACRDNLVSTTGWLCGACAHLNTETDKKCVSCALGKDEAVPPLEESGKHLLLSVRKELERREEALKLKEIELGIAAGSGTAKTKSTASSDAPSRFDGTDAGGSQDKMPEQPDLIPKGYNLPTCASSVDGRSALQFLGKWISPLGIPLWEKETVDDFVADSDFLVKDNRHKQGGGDPPFVIRSLYAYTHSQLGPRTIWAVWKPEQKIVAKQGGDKKDKIEPGRWEPLSSPGELEANHEKHDFHIPPTAGICKALGMDATSIGDSLQLTHIQSNPKVGLKCYKSNLGGVFFARYDNALRGHRTYSPLRDTIMWIPAGPKLKQIVKENVRANILPTAGVLEYIAANPPNRKLDGGEVWTCQPYVDPALDELKKKCLQMANQQHACKELHKAAMLVLEQVPKKQTNFPEISKEVFRNTFMANTRFDSESTLTPEEIARAFTLQCLTWNQNHFLLALTTTPTETRTPHTLCSVSDGKVYDLFRVASIFWPQQIYNNLNMSMRETQFGHPDAVLKFKPRQVLLSQGFVGKYVSKQPESFEGLEREMKPSIFKGSSRGLFGTADQTTVTYSRADSCWNIRFATGVTHPCEPGDVIVRQYAWMLPQVRPLIFLTNKSLAHVQANNASAFDKKTYRGMSCTLNRSEYDIGKVLVWAQYSSTSVDQGVAADFAKGENPAAVFTIRGGSCVPIANFSRFAREAEVLYRENTCFKVEDALSAEAAQILGKENLQIFTLQEISETKMACTLVKKLLPRAETSAAASVVFQAEEALRGDRCLELSIDSVTAGEVPARWQYFIKNPTHSCRIPPSTVWENWEGVGVGKIKRARERLLVKVGEDEVLDNVLFVRSQPEGQVGTWDVTSVKVTGGNPNCNGIYKRDSDDSWRFTRSENDSSLVMTAGKTFSWCLEFGDDSVSYTSPNLLGEWQTAEGTIKVTIDRSRRENVLVPRCSNDGSMMHKGVTSDHECESCYNDIKGPCFYCRRCSTHVCAECVSKVEFDTSGYQLFDNNLAVTENGDIEGFITSLKFRDEKFIDNLGRSVEPDYPEASQFTSLARLCSEALIDAAFPANLESTASHVNIPLFEVCDKLTGPNWRADRVRLYGQCENEEEESQLKMKIGSAEGWCFDVDLRRTSARPGLAIGDAGAEMVAAIVSLGVPLKVLGLRNNRITVKGARQILAAVKSNKNVIESMIGDEKVSKKKKKKEKENEAPQAADPQATLGEDDSDSSEGEDDEEEGGELRDLTEAISLRCIYHSCLQEGTPLLDSHLAGLGPRWPNIIGLAFGDIEGLKLPIAGILGNHPEGYDAMLKQFKSKPEVSHDVLHTACQTGKVAAVLPLLNNCKCNPEAEIGGKVPFELAINTNFDNPEGEKALKQLVLGTDMKKLPKKLFLKAATSCAVAIDVLMGEQIEPESTSEVAMVAVKHKRFGSGPGRSILRNRLLPSDILKEHGESILHEAARHFNSGHHGILHEIISAGVPIEFSTNSPLHLICKHPASQDDLELLSKLITEEHKQQLPDSDTTYYSDDENDDIDGDDDDDLEGLTCLEISAAVSPVVTSYLIDKGFKVSKQALEVACRTPRYNDKDNIDHLRKLTKGMIKEECRALHNACKKGHLLVASTLLNEGMRPPDKLKNPIRDCCRCISYAWGSCDDSKQIMQTLIEVKGLEEHRPLKLAISCGAVDAALFLVEKGASVKEDVKKIKEKEPAQAGEAEAEEEEEEEDEFACDDEAPYLSTPLSHLLGKHVRIEEHEHGPRLIDSILTKDTPDLSQALVSACQNGISITLVKKLLSLGADVNFIGLCQTTPLSAACTSPLFGNHLDVFEQLITPTTINKSNDIDETPLSLALSTANINMIQLLLKKGAEKPDADVIMEALCKPAFHTPEGVELAKGLLTKEQLNPEDGRSPLNMALEEGLVEYARILISLGCDPECGFGKEDYVSPLQEAAQSEILDNPENCDFLSHLATKKLINHKDSDGQTALQQAAYWGHLTVSKTLIGLGADTSNTDNSGHNILHLAATEEVWSNSEGLTILEGVIKATPKLINDANKEGDTPLADCISNSAWGMAILLLDCGASTDITVQGKPLLHAFEHNLNNAGIRVMKRIIAQDHELLNKVDDKGNTPLIAAARQQSDATPILISCGADINVRDAKRRTPLHLFCRMLNLQFVEMALENSAKPDLHDSKGYTPLSIAVRHRATRPGVAEQIVQKLLPVTKPPYLKEGMILKDEKFRELLKLKPGEFEGEEEPPLSDGDSLVSSNHDTAEDDSGESSGWGTDSDVDLCDEQQDDDDDDDDVPDLGLDDLVTPNTADLDLNLPSDADLGLDLDDDDLLDLDLDDKETKK